MTSTVLILNGPGLSDLSHYKSIGDATMTLAEIEEDCAELCKSLGLELDFRQTDNQDEMFRWIAKDSEGFDGVIINPVGHSQSAIQKFELYRSAIQMIANLKKPIIEVHISNIYRQVAEITQPLHEPVGDMGFICGLGKYSYLLALRAIARKLHTADGSSSASG
jgi:3-dehydroquinate dehydratase-2